MPEVTILAQNIRALYLNSGTPTGADVFHTGEDKTFSETFRTLMTFDFSEIPPGSKINSVTFRGWLEQAGSFRASNNRTLRFFRMIQPWTTAATWSNYDGSNAWQTAGAGGANDRESSDIGSGTCLTSWADESSHDFTLDADAIKEWVDGVFDNEGLITKMDTENADRFFWHRDTSGKEPRLIIDYTPPPSGLIVF